MVKKLFKTCPKCKFAKCWVGAKKCEECLFDFVLGRKPRKEKLPEYSSDDDEMVVLPTSNPAQTTKECPACKHGCWHTAPFCEKCEWNFKTNSPKELPKVVPLKKQIQVTEPRKTFFGGRMLVTTPATGGYGHLLKKRSNQIFVVKPPVASTATYNNVAQWIDRLQSHAKKVDGSEYAESACAYLVSCARMNGRSDLQNGGDLKVIGLVNDVFTNLESGIALSFTPEEETEIPDVLVAIKEEEPVTPPSDTTDKREAAKANRRKVRSRK